MANGTLKIRIAGSDDGERLREMMGFLVPNDIDTPAGVAADRYRQMMTHPGLTVFLAEIDHETVGTCTLLVVPNLSRGGAPFALIENVVTHPDYRSSGIGAKVMEAAIERAWADGCYKIMLMSGEANQAAHRFYERIGFEKRKTGFEIRAPGYPPRSLV